MMITTLAHGYRIAADVAQYRPGVARKPSYAPPSPTPETITRARVEQQRRDRALPVRRSRSDAQYRPGVRLTADAPDRASDDPNTPPALTPRQADVCPFLNDAPRKKAYIVLRDELRWRYVDELPIRWYLVPRAEYRASEWYYDDAPPMPDGYKWVTFARFAGTNARREYYVKVSEDK